MSDAVRLGPYQIARETRGLHFWRPGIGPDGLIGVMRFSLEEPGRDRVYFSLSSIRLEGQTLQLRGEVGDRFSLYVELVFVPALQGFDLSTRFHAIAASADVRVTINLELPGEADPKWLIPGLFYGDNRPKGCDRLFPGFSEISRDPSRFLSNYWGFRSDRAALPVVFANTYNSISFLMVEGHVEGAPKAREGFHLTGLGFDTEEAAPRLRVSLPYNEEPVKFSYCHESRTAKEGRFWHLRANEGVTFRATFGMHPYDEERGWRPVYRALWQRLNQSQAAPRTVDAELAESLAIDGLLRHHVDVDTGMIHETTAFDKHFGRRGTQVERQVMHCGWLSGAPCAYVLLWQGRDSQDPQQVRSAHAVFDRITSELSPCGTLWPVFGWPDENLPGLGPVEGLAHSRTVAEAVLYLVRALRLDILASTSHKNWSRAVEATLSFILSKQHPSGAFPSYWDVETGVPHNFDGCAGIAWIPALIGAANLLSRGDFREAALRAGEYYSTFVESDFLYGCIEDQPLVPSCDDGHQALLAYLLLYEMDRSPLWLTLARQAADYALTFRFAYNVSFPSWTMLAQARFCTLGGDITSVATPATGPHGLFSHPELLKLSALTGDPYYKQRAEEGRRFAEQCVALGDGHYNASMGQTLGQIYHTDWWQPKGKVLSLGHAWSAAALAYSGLVERHLDIPESALQGDMESVLSISETGPIAMQEQVEMPESAEAILRRSRAAVATTTGGRMDILGSGDTSSRGIPRPSTRANRRPSTGAFEERSSTPFHTTPPPAAPNFTEEFTPQEQVAASAANEEEGFTIQWDRIFRDDPTGREQPMPAQRPAAGPPSHLTVESLEGKIIPQAPENLLAGLMNDLKTAKKHTTLSDLRDPPSAPVERPATPTPKLRKEESEVEEGKDELRWKIF